MFLKRFVIPTWLMNVFRIAVLAAFAIAIWQVVPSIWRMATTHQRVVASEGTMAGDAKEGSWTWGIWTLSWHQGETRCSFNLQDSAKISASYGRLPGLCNNSPDGLKEMLQNLLGEDHHGFL